MTGPRTTELDIPAESRFVATARNFVAEAARNCDWIDEEQLDDLRLVVSETVTNALHAQAERQVDELIHLQTIVFDDRIEIVVADSAGGFDPPAEALPLPEPDLGREGGFGLPLIEALSDEAHFTVTAAGTTVRVVVYRHGPDSDPTPGP